MALKIRLQRHGSRNAPFYRMVVAEARARRDGRYVELLGTYNPRVTNEENLVNLKMDRIDYWTSVGAQPSDTAKSLIKKVRRNTPSATEA
jgi:small subunit ribosomal protein S16